jgi:hypothetical protein
LEALAQEYRRATRFGGSLAERRLHRDLRAPGTEMVKVTL